jgi:hypothetical protein
MPTRLCEEHSLHGRVGINGKDQLSPGGILSGPFLRLVLTAASLADRVSDRLLVTGHERAHKVTCHETTATTLPRVTSCERTALDWNRDAHSLDHRIKLRVDAEASTTPSAFNAMIVGVSAAVAARITVTRSPPSPK